LLTLVVIPVLYYVAYRHRLDAIGGLAGAESPVSSASTPSIQSE
jgi:hypothetical protein